MSNILDPTPGPKSTVLAAAFSVSKDQGVSTARQAAGAIGGQARTVRVGAFLSGSAALLFGLFAPCAPALAGDLAAPTAVTGQPSSTVAAARGALPTVDPMDLPSEITDPNNVLGSKKASVQKALDELAEQGEYQLFVVFVDTFDGQDGVDWANATATLSGLGNRDLLLAVATTERRYGISYANDSGLSDSDLDTIETATESKLRKSDWAGSAIAAANATADVTAGGSPTGALVGAGVGAVAIAGGAIGLVAYNRRKKNAGQSTTGPDELNTLSTADLNRRTSSALVAIDDAIRTSDQELGFAQAQFGEEATRTFTEALTAAKQGVAQAFALRQQLDDDTPEAEPQARTMMAQIIGICADVTDSLDAQSKTFDELRDLQAKAPQMLDGVERAVAEAGSRIDVSRTNLGTLSTTYPATALASIIHNPDQAQALLRNATESITQGRAALTANDRAKAVALGRAAENAVDQARTLLDTVDRAGSDLAEASVRIDKGLASITADLTEAGRLPTSDPVVTAAVSTAVAEANAAVAVAQQARSTATGDPLGGLTRLTSAEAALDAALAPLREQAEQAARANALLRETLGRVDSQIRSTNDYITTRRGAVGPEARTRLSEAIRLLGEAQAMQPTDPAGALVRAQQAEAMAQSAAQLAQQDTTSWSGGIGQGTGSGSNVGGMVLGGILLDAILGGGNRGGGFGGGFGGGGFGGGSHSGGSRRSSGSRSSGGRSSSSRSSGGRSGRGGRF